MEIKYTGYNPYRKIDPSKMPAAAGNESQQYIIGCDMAPGVDYVGIPSDKYAAMREALEKARKVLYAIRMDDWPGITAVQEALEAIDKAKGGCE